MSTQTVGEKLVDLCKQGKDLDAVKQLYDQNVVSKEAASPNNEPTETKGVNAVVEKIKMWFDDHTIHSTKIKGPFPNGDHFAVYFTYDVTNKKNSQRFNMEEIGIFKVENDKIIKDKYYYDMGNSSKT